MADYPADFAWSGQRKVKESEPVTARLAFIRCDRLQPCTRSGCRRFRHQAFDPEEWLELHFPEAGGQETLPAVIGGKGGIRILERMLCRLARSRSLCLLAPPRSGVSA